MQELFWNGDPCPHSDDEDERPEPSQTTTQNKHALVNQASYWEEEKILNNKLPVQFLPKLISNLIKKIIIKRLHMK